MINFSFETKFGCPIKLAPHITTDEFRNKFLRERETEITIEWLWFECQLTANWKEKDEPKKNS